MNKENLFTNAPQQSSSHPIDFNHKSDESANPNGYDSSQYYGQNNGGNGGQGGGSNWLNEVSNFNFGGGGAHNQSQLDNFVKKHQDATLNKNHWVTYIKS